MKDPEQTQNRMAHQSNPPDHLAAVDLPSESTIFSSSLNLNRPPFYSESVIAPTPLLIGENPFLSGAKLEDSLTEMAAPNALSAADVYFY